MRSIMVFSVTSDICNFYLLQYVLCVFSGLRREDLVFYFVDELKTTDCPETIHLKSNGIFFVNIKFFQGMVLMY